MTSILCAWLNDIYSFKKESANNDPLNLISILIASNKLSIKEAFNAAVEVYNKDLPGDESFIA